MKGLKELTAYRMVLWQGKIFLVKTNGRGL